MGLIKHGKYGQVNESIALQARSAFKKEQVKIAKGIAIDEEDDAFNAAKPASPGPAGSARVRKAPSGRFQLRNVVNVVKAPTRKRPGQPASSGGGPSGSASAAAAATTVVARPSSVGLTCKCHQCLQVFGVPPGASAVRCPHCHAANNVAAITGAAPQGAGGPSPPPTLYPPRI